MSNELQALKLSVSADEVTEIKLLLRQSALFKWMNDESLDTIVSRMKTKSYKQGDLIIEQGQSQSKVFVIREGSVSRHRRDDQDGRVHLIEYAHKSRVHGALHALREDPAFGSIKCESDTSVYEISSAELRALILANQTMTEQALYGLSREIRVTSKALRTPLFELKSTPQTPPFLATSIAASFECFYRSFMSSLMIEKLTGQKTPRFPTMHIQMPTRIFYINGFKGLRYFLENHVNVEAYSNPQLMRILVAITPGVVMTPISSFLEATNAIKHNPEPLHRRMFRGIVPRGCREVIFGVGLNQLTDFMEERVPENLVTTPLYRNMCGSAMAAVASGYLSHFPHNLSSLKLVAPHKTYGQIFAEIGTKAEARLPSFLQDKGSLTTWAGRISCIVTPATFTVRTGQLIGSFVILNGIITFINTQSPFKVQSPK